MWVEPVRSSASAYTQNISVDATLPAVTSPVSWIQHATRVERKGSKSDTAQCLPGELTRYLCSVFLAQPNAELLIARATGMKRNEAGRVISVVVSQRVDGRDEETVVKCDTLVLAAGPWLSNLTGTLLGDSRARGLEITASQANSIILRTRAKQGAHAIFARIAMGGEEHENEPEVYCRPDGTTYLCVRLAPS